MIGTLVDVIMYIAFIAISGTLAFSAIYLWMNWYTDGSYKEPHDRSFKTIFTTIGLGILILMLVLNAIK